MEIEVREVLERSDLAGELGEAAIAEQQRADRAGLPQRRRKALEGAAPRARLLDRARPRREVPLSRNGEPDVEREATAASHQDEDMAVTLPDQDPEALSDVVERLVRPTE